MVTVVLLPGRGSTLTQAPTCGPVSLFKLGPAWLLWTCLESWTLGYLYLCMSLPSLLGAVALCSLSISEASALSLGVMLALLSLAVPCHCWKKTCKAERCLALNGVTVETRSALWAQCRDTAIAKKKKKKQNKGKTNKQENQLNSLINILILNFSVWNRCFSALYVLIPIFHAERHMCSAICCLKREQKLKFSAVGHKQRGSEHKGRDFPGISFELYREMYCSWWQDTETWIKNAISSTLATQSRTERRWQWKH